jgi:amino acid transporter
VTSLASPLRALQRKRQTEYYVIGVCTAQSILGRILFLMSSVDTMFAVSTGFIWFLLLFVFFAYYCPGAAFDKTGLYSKLEQRIGKTLFAGEIIIGVVAFGYGTYQLVRMIIDG